MKKTKNPTFEIVKQIRDKNGNPTGKIKREFSDHATVISNFWESNGGDFWEDRTTTESFLMADTPSVTRSKKNASQGQGARIALLKRLQKLLKSNKERSAEQGVKIFTENTINTATDIINSISDLIRVKIRIVTNNNGVVTLEFNSYYEGEQALEVSILNNEVSYNFWNGNLEDQEHSDYKMFDRKKIRQLVSKFNKGLKR